MPTVSPIRKALQAIDLFAHLPSHVLHQLASFSTLRSVRQGETIFCQGEPSPYCFGILSGEIIIQRVSKDARFLPKILGVLGPGELFGESCFFEDSPRAAMATVSREGRLVAIQGERLRAWLHQEPAVGTRLLMGMLDSALVRLRQTSHELSVLYGAGRLLGSSQAMKDQLHMVLEFLKSSLEKVDDLVFYRKNPYWDEFEWVTSLPSGAPMPALSLEAPFVRRLGKGEEVLVLKRSKISPALEETKIPWGKYAAMAVVPLRDRDEAHSPLQGFLLLGSQRNADSFSSSLVLLLSSVATLLAESLSRERRQEEALAQTRLAQSRQSIKL
jgi:CRP-like cAMP-binding protein